MFQPIKLNEAIAWTACRTHSEGFCQATNLAQQIEPFGQAVDRKCQELNLYYNQTDWENEPLSWSVTAEPDPDHAARLEQAKTFLKGDQLGGSEYEDFVEVFSLLVTTLNLTYSG